MNWMDIKGWLTDVEGKKLQELAAGKVVLELGTHYGRSAACMAVTAERVVTIDVHYKSDTLEKCYYNMKACGVGDKVEIIKKDHRNLSKSDFKDTRFDVIFVDGAHNFESVVRDTQLAMSIVKFGGVIAWHDYRCPDYPEVAEAMEYCGFRNIKTAGSVAWSK